MHGMTQAELAHRVLTTQDRVSRIEKDEARCDAELEQMLAVELGVTSDCLRRAPAAPLQALSPQFRARSRVSQRDRSVALEWANLVNEEYQRLTETAAALPTRLSREDGEGPADAARRVRHLLGFNQREPLPYLVLAVERLGVRVLGLPITLSTMDGFSAWHGDTPIIGLMTGVPADRVRFTVAHELGHLVLHRPGQAGREIEAEADAFAAELLTPRDSIVTALPSNPTLNSLTMVKTRWGVSVKALVRRARELGVIDADRSLSLYKQLSKRGWNRQEPGFVPEEKPRGFRKLAEIAYGAGPNTERLAQDAGWSEELALTVLRQYARSDELPRKVARSGSAETRADNVVRFPAHRRATSRASTEQPAP